MSISSKFLLGTLFSLGGFLMAAPVAVKVGEKGLMIESDGQPILTYHTAEMPAPDGESELYRRSGFIHPLHAPNGDIVTSIHAPDHFHHMGLWHAWVRTNWNGDKMDFWNLKGGRGTVRYVETKEIHEADNTAGFTVRQQQVALAHEGRPETVVLEELLKVTVSAAAEANVVDYVITQTNVSASALEMPAYRYGGGIAYRAPSAWGESDQSYVTSEGLDRTEGHATRGDWVAMRGPTKQGEAMVVIMGHPANHDAPQRMRIWPEGEVFFNYVPAQEFDWQIAPQESVTLAYRVVVFSDPVSAREIERYWADYRDSR